MIAFTKAPVIDCSNVEPSWTVKGPRGTKSGRQSEDLMRETRRGENDRLRDSLIKQSGQDRVERRAYGAPRPLSGNATTEKQVSRVS